MKKKIKEVLSGALFPVVVVIVLLFFLAALNNLRAGSGDEGKNQLEQALKRSAVACYASEGIYPPDLNYMKEHYGIQVDESRYIVIYEVFAQNLMPEITVLEKKNEK